MNEIEIYHQDKQIKLVSPLDVIYIYICSVFIFKAMNFLQLVPVES